ncbi:MAG: tryptophan--tRNA ligase [Rhodothermaeota bacterium MED-G19]|nr:MAG: tryptophan--tRNA ligase [Rhodothermaeota bacterium MED-G19]
MTRVLTGIQSSGKPHLGNVLGAINPSIELSKNSKNDSLFFIADLHSLINIKDSKKRNENTLAVAASWIAMGFDHEKNYFYRQSRITEVCELAWYLNCFTPYPMLSNSHSFKDKSDNLSDINSGLFTYPVLMAADILLYDSEIVPVGKDQKQHLEITRDIAKSFNHNYGDTFIIPESRIDKNVQTIPGTDGRKMSKTYENTIDIFTDEKTLKKQIMSIVTDSKGLKDKKDPDSCNIFNIFKLIASKDDVEKMKNNYLEGGYGYGHAKNNLLSLILDLYKEERNLYDELLKNPDHLYGILEKGENKARTIAKSVLDRVKNKLGY